jgi:hypothetical protein
MAAYDMPMLIKTFHVLLKSVKLFFFNKSVSWYFCRKGFNNVISSGDMKCIPNFVMMGILSKTFLRGRSALWEKQHYSLVLSDVLFG